MVRAIDKKPQEEQYQSFDEYESDRKRVRSSYLDQVTYGLIRIPFLHKQFTKMSQVPNGPAKLEVLTSAMEAKLAEAGSRFASRYALEIQREISRCKTEVDAAQRELLNVKLEV